MITRDAVPLRKDSLEQRLLELSQQVVLQTHQRTEVAAIVRQKLAKPGPIEPNQVVRLSQKVEGDICCRTALLFYAHARRVCWLEFCAV